MPQSEIHRETVFPGVNFTKKTPLTSLKRWGRRANQLGQILFSSRYESTEALVQSMVQYYSDEKEVNFYEEYSNFGLHENEEEVLNFVGSRTHPMNILVVGCGAGREVFALKKEFNSSKILGIDLSPSMIFKAQKNNRSEGVEFAHCGVDDLEECYDFIWVTALLESHIQGKENRIAFFLSLRELCNSTVTPVILTPQIRKLHWRSLTFWSSQLLRLRWLMDNKWEVGDVLLSNLGAHNTHQHLIFSHFYPTDKHLKDELRAAGFTVFKKMDQESWVIF